MTGKENGPLSAERRRALFEARIQKARLDNQPAAAKRSAVDRNVWPLSSGQGRLLFLEQMDVDCRAYRIPIAIRLRGPLDVNQLQRAWRSIVNDQPVLRARIDLSELEPRQLITREVDAQIEIIECESEAELEFNLQKLQERPFSLTQGPTWTAALLQRSSIDALLFIEIHHCFFDGRSQDLLLDTLSKRYSGAESEPAPMETYGDFASWQNSHKESTTHTRDEAYWLEHLAGELPTLALPEDHHRPTQQQFDGKLVQLRLDQPSVSALRKLSQDQSVTTYMVLLTVYYAWLYRYTGQSDLIVGTPVTATQDPRWDGVIGLMVNTLALRCQVEREDTFATLLAKVRDLCIAGFDHQSLPFEDLVAKLKPARVLDRSPVFQTLFAFRGAQTTPVDFEGVESEWVTLESATANTDLSFWVQDADQHIDIAAEFASSLFEESSVTQWLSHFQNLLTAALENPQESIGNLPILAQSDVERVQQKWNSTQAEIPTQLLSDRIAALSTEDQKRAAVSSSRGTISYGELNANANAIASHIAGRFETGSVIGVCVERSEHLLSMILGIWRAGYSYLPLDPAFPHQRIGFMLDDSGSAAVLFDDSTHAILPDRPIAKIALNDALSGHQSESAPPSLPASSARSIAYVIYTSGSTGQPKGVRVSHQSLTNFLASMAQEPGLDSTDTLAAVTTISFDISLLELCLPAWVSAQCFVIDASVATDPNKLAETLVASDATVMQATPALWRMLTDNGWHAPNNFRVLSGGERLTIDLARHKAFSKAQIWNLYGPTETTIWSTLEHVEHGQKAITIGRPIANTSAYVLDESQQIVPRGVIGEIVIGGDGVAEGYHRRPELSAERFFANPYGPGRLYRTGDLGRRLADGRIDHLGRVDTQMKIRGYRIEPGEIEETLRDSEFISDAAVMVHETDNADHRLVAYVVPAVGQRPSPVALRKSLRAFLPNYMIPQQFILLDTLPLTANGKVDHRALPVPGGSPWLKAERSIAPRTTAEKGLAKMWSAALGRSNISVNENFFDAGGHSLLSLKIIREIEARWGIRLSPQTFILDTLEQIAAQIDDGPNLHSETNQGQE